MQEKKQVLVTFVTKDPNPSHHLPGGSPSIVRDGPAGGPMPRASASDSLRLDWWRHAVAGSSLAFASTHALIHSCPLPCASEIPIPCIDDRRYRLVLIPNLTPSDPADRPADGPCRRHPLRPFKNHQPSFGAGEGCPFRVCGERGGALLVSGFSCLVTGHQHGRCSGGRVLPRGSPADAAGRLYARRLDKLCERDRSL